MTTRWTFIIICVIGMTLRISKASLTPITYDEAASFLNYALTPLSNIFSDYSFPNNHILNSTGMRAMSMLFGPQEFYLRIPSLLGSLLLMPSFGYLLWRAYGPIAGLVAAIWVATQPFLAGFGSIARGYSLGMGFLYLAMALYVAQMHRKHISAKWFFLIAVSMTLAIGSVPVFVNAVGAFLISVMMLLLLQRVQMDTIVRHTGLMVVPAVIMTQLWYSQIHTDPSAYPWGHDMIVHSLAETLNAAFSLKFLVAYTETIAWLILLAILLAIAVTLWRKNQPAFLLSSSALLVIMATVGEHHLLGFKYPFPRTWQFLFPMLFAVAYTLIRELGTQLPGWARKSATGTITVAILAFHFSHYKLIGVYPWLHLTPVKSAIQSMRKVQDTPRVCYSWIYNMSFQYYDYVYYWKTIEDCNQETTQYVFTSSVMANGLSTLPRAEVLFTDPQDNTEVFKIAR